MNKVLIWIGGMLAGVTLGSLIEKTYVPCTPNGPGVTFICTVFLIVVTIASMVSNQEDMR